MKSGAKCMLHYLKRLSEDDIKILENQPLDPCYLCNEQICSNPLKSYIILSFHRSCLEEHALVTKANCPVCEKEEMETTKDSSGELLSQSSGTSSITQMLDKNLRIDSNRKLQEIPEDEDINEFQDEMVTDETLDTSECRTSESNASIVSPLKRVRKPSSTDKPPKKKTKKNGKREPSIFIQELTTVTEEHPSVPLEEREDADDLFNLYVKITKAEGKRGLANQEVIRCYYFFGKALWGRFEVYRLLHLEHESQKKVNEEVQQQLNVSKDTLRKATQLGRRIYDLFSRIGEDKISRVKTFSTWDILKLKNEDVEHIISEVMWRDNAVTVTRD